MKTYGYGYAMSDDEDSNPYADDEKPKKPLDSDEVTYEFEGYDVEINTKVVLLPKTTKAL